MKEKTQRLENQIKRKRLVLELKRREARILCFSCDLTGRSVSTCHFKFNRSWWLGKKHSKLCGPSVKRGNVQKSEFQTVGRGGTVFIKKLRRFFFLVATAFLKPRPVGRVHEAAIFFIGVRAAGGAKVDAERSSDGLSMSMFFKPCPERAMLLIAPSISTWRRPAKTFFKKPA